MRILPSTLRLIIFAWLGLVSIPCRADESQFRCLVLSEEFHSEGADFGDFNGDGYNDIVSGPFWYQGPEFRQRHRYMAGERHSIKAYSKHFFSFTYDFNSDDRPDVLVVGMPGKPAHWYENPGGSDAFWAQHPVLDDVGNESPTLADLTGDGKPELVCVHQGAFGYAEPNLREPNKGWKFYGISDSQSLGTFTHGLGIGDVDGDGRHDVLETNGWYRQTSNQQEAFAFQPQKFSEAGGAQMFAYDFDGDGDNDIISVQNAHAWGLTWFERRGAGDDFLWVPHAILTHKPSDNEFGLAISQMHGVALADIDGDGVKDIVTGKRFFAHGGGDPGAFQLPALYWFRTMRLRGGGVRFEPHLIHSRVGVGTQLTVGDVNKDGRIDLVVGNKLGTFVLLNEPAKNSLLDLTRVKPSLAGTPDFSRGVRDVGPLTPELECKTFVLPEGFEARLFAAEPEIAKPLNMAFDARGRLWITNTVEYPYPVEVGQPGRDSIKILEDTNGDGRADAITTFADGLNIPMGLYPYRDGVICFSIPNIWFLRDTVGDGKCDSREILYGPFDHTRDAHGLCNAFTRGYDGWLYACHGFNNQSTVTGRDGNTVTMHSGNTFRFKLDGSRIEHFTHGQVNPFGMSYDARGDLLTADCHTKPVTLLLPGAYYESFGKPHDGLGFVPNVMEHLHGSTAIGGIAITQPSTNWPSAFQNNALGGNVMTSRVNRNSLVYSGSSILAQEEADFLISGDSWFRPVDLQFGPDGALYIADFYNRIIGHYEVPLEHPGRDRDRGRIWRITYNGSTNRRDTKNNSSPLPRADLAKLTPEALVRTFQSASSAQRMLAADRLVDEFGRAAVAPARKGLKHDSPNVRLHCLWALSRLNTVTEEELEIGVNDKDPLVRTHVQKLISELTTPDPARLIEWLTVGLADADPTVCRAAATSCTKKRDALLVPALLECLDRNPETDVHLRHAIRLALKHQLKDEFVFAIATENIQPRHVPLLAGVCLAIPTEPAANFIVDQIEILSNESQSRVTEYVRYAARYVSVEAIPDVVTLVRSRFSDDEGLQLELLQSIGDGLKRRNLAAPEATQAWARDLAEELLAFDQFGALISWRSLPHPDIHDAANAWAVSEKRDSADGKKATSLWSSFPNGEQRTGIYRSSAFRLGDTFGFFIAGHDGFPQEALQHRNSVRIRDRTTHQVLKSWSPPRQDTAQHREWKTEAFTGREVYVELVDGDASDAYAWIAVGRFSDSRLNPNRLLKDRQAGCKLVSEFGLIQLRPNLAQLMQRRDTDNQTRVLVAKALTSLSPTGLQNALAESLNIASLPQDLQLEATRLITSGPKGTVNATKYLENALKFASSIEQQSIAEQLATDRSGTETLLDLVVSSQLHARFLKLPNIVAKLDAIASSNQQEQIDQLTGSLADENESIATTIQEWKTAFLQAGGDASKGKTIFAKQCGICHQVASQGQQVGPNLDGIGNRGLDRLIEDVLAPNRNVDVAFRATTVVTSDGQAITGLRRGVDGAVLTMIDTKGEAIQIPISSIEDQSTSTLSPMPANFHALLSKPKSDDLMSYLLSLTK